MGKYKYNEDVYLHNFQKYLSGTYGEHYVAKDIQVVDIWESLDSLETTARDTAIKYLCRYGKKDGKNKKDLMKAMHYIVLMMYAGDKQQEKQPMGPEALPQVAIQDAYEKVEANYSPFYKRGEKGEIL